MLKYLSVTLMLLTACSDPVVPCGDGTCDLESGETPASCPQDCASGCGDSTCAGGETGQSCPVDCFCGNGSCDAAENQIVCPQDCTSADCGNGACEQDESSDSCPVDCPEAVCGNGYCETGESTLSCPQDCLSPLCGNGVCEPPEDSYACLEDCPAVCGDGILNFGEDCDQGLPPGADCQSVAGHVSGVLGCSGACAFDISGCSTCGDDVRTGAEQCDGADLDAQTCASTGHTGGTLGCASDCTFDESACHDCGDQLTEGPEACDGVDVGAETCSTLAGHVHGVLGCLPDCSGFDPSDCHTCGNAQLEGSEPCDGALLAGQTCATQTGLVSGTLACEPGCGGFDTSDCYTCGDGAIHGPEDCDGATLAGETCPSQTGHASGTLTCLGDCLGFDTAGCHTCGDGVPEGPEACDGTIPAGVDCTDVGYTGGTVACTGGCQLDPASCWLCGNGICEWEQGELSAQCAADCEPVVWTSFAAGQYNTCGQTHDTTLYCWGSNSYGQVGTGTAGGWFDTPQLVQGLPAGAVVSYTQGHELGCAVLDTGGVYCWGRNGFGQLGDGTYETRLTPTAVVGISTGAQVCGSYLKTFARLQDGSVYGWGSNTGGVLGIGSTVPTTSPTPLAVVGLPAPAVDLVCGGGTFCARLDNNSTWCWGAGASGQLGNGTFVDVSMVPVPVTGLVNVVSIAAAREHFCAVTSNGALRCWGENSDRQLGNGSTTDSSVPITVSGFSPAVAAGVGWKHTCAALADGTVWCWGCGVDGQLGLGNNFDYSSPQQVLGGPTGVIDVLAHLRHSCVITATGAMWCWGSNASGQLGTPFTSLYAPSQVADP